MQTAASTQEPSENPRTNVRALPDPNCRPDQQQRDQPQRYHSGTTAGPATAGPASAGPAKAGRGGGVVPGLLGTRSGQIEVVAGGAEVACHPYWRNCICPNMLLRLDFVPFRKGPEK